MNTKTEKVIHYNSPEAATYQTGLSGWVDRYGRFWGNDEHMARYCGATHKDCETCGKLTDMRHYCRACAEKREVDKFHAMPKEQWNGEDVLYSQAFDRYFFDASELMDDIHYSGKSIEEYMLIICAPIYLSELCTDYWCDDLPEDGELPSDVAEALDTLNKAIMEAGPVSFTPGDTAAIVTMEDLQ